MVYTQESRGQHPDFAIIWFKEETEQVTRQPHLEVPEDVEWDICDRS